MKIVRFHHQGHLDSFAYDQFLRVCRARYLVDLYTFQVSGVRDEDDATSDDFVAGHISDPIVGIRAIDPALTAGPSAVYDVSRRIMHAYEAAYDELKLEKASRLEFCENAYRVLKIEDGFVLPRIFSLWCDVRRDYFVARLDVAEATGLLYMRRRNLYDAYVAWVATVR